MMMGIHIGIGTNNGGAASVGATTPVLPGNAFTYIDADDLAGAVSDPVTAWASRTDAVAGGGPYDWASSDTGVIDESTLSGSRRSVLFDGTSQHMLAAAGLEAELSGEDIPFTRYLHGYTVAIVSNDCVMSCSNGAFTHIDIMRQRSDGQWRMQRTGVLIDSGVGTLVVGEFKLVDIHHGTTRTIWADDVKVVDAVAADSASLTFTKIALAALVGDSVAGAANIAVRRHGYWNVAFNDAQSLALPAVGT